VQGTTEPFIHDFLIADYLSPSLCETSLRLTESAPNGSGRYNLKMAKYNQSLIDWSCFHTPWLKGFLEQIPGKFS